MSQIVWVIMFATNFLQEAFSSALAACSASVKRSKQLLMRSGQLQQPGVAADEVRPAAAARGCLQRSGCLTQGLPRLPEVFLASPIIHRPHPALVPLRETCKLVFWPCLVSLTNLVHGVLVFFSSSSVADRDWL